jgi:hypothetical protein
VLHPNRRIAINRTRLVQWFLRWWPTVVAGIAHGHAQAGTGSWSFTSIMTGNGFSIHCKSFFNTGFVWSRRIIWCKQRYVVPMVSGIW